MGARMVVVGLVLLLGCRKSDEAPAAFNDPLIGALASFGGEEELLAGLLRELEAQLYTELEIEGSDIVARSIEPDGITEADVAGFSPRPARDPAAAGGIALAFASDFPVERHAVIPVQADQRPMEPASPDHYDREFIEGQDCWSERGCTWLKTFQELTKVYTGDIVPPITYAFTKPFRWINLAAGTDAAPRWAYGASAFNDDSYSSENGKNTLWQSYSIELWFPRDGGGFRWEDDGGAPPDDKHGDSDGGGTLRFLCVWSENDIALASSESMEIGTIRWGIDRNFAAHEEWLEAHPDVQ